MNLASGAILAAVVLLAAGPLAEPKHVRFQLADGVQVTGSMTAWDADGFDGSFGRRLWVELASHDIWRLYRLVMDPNDAAQWVDLGGVLLRSSSGDSMAEHAFDKAVRLDDSMAEQIEAAREAARKARRLQEELQRTMDAQRLATGTPEAGLFALDPWPVVSPDEQLKQLVAVKTEAERILRQAGLMMIALETDHFVVYVAGPLITAARLASQLEATYERMASGLGLDVSLNVFAGKAIVFYFSDRDRFRLVEAEAFGQLVSRRLVAICHPVGANVFINLCGELESEAFRAALVHETVHGFMHRYRTPRRLPPWANEGLAEYVSATLLSESPSHETRTRGLKYIRNGQSVQLLLDATYGDLRPDAAEVVGAVGALLIEIMVGERLDGFRHWVNAVKDGKEWTPALGEHYGVPRNHLVNTFIQYYLVND